MPSFILLKSPGGASPGEQIPLDGDLLVIGRDADTCQIVIPHHAVSRRHAQVSRVNGHFYIEDLRSRNHTFVNNKEVVTRTQLKPEDRVKICDFLFRYHDERRPAPAPGRSSEPIPLPDDMLPEKSEDDDPGGMTTIEATGNRVNAQHFLDTQPAERLRALLDITASLNRTLDLAPLLDQIATTLFGVFRQADRCFVILLEEGGRLVPKVAKARRPGMEEARFSKTIVKKAISEMQSYLSEDASADASLGPAASIAEFKIRSVMCVPLSTGEGQPIGAIQLDTQDRAKKFSVEDLSLLSIVANLAAVAVEKARWHAAALVQEKAQKEIELARTVQLGFLPQTVPQVSGHEFYSHYSPAQTVGGDYYDFVQLPGGRVAVVLGDVAGKGVPAAILVAKLSSEVRFCLLTEPDPARAISLLNDQMMRGGLGDRFVTLAAAILDPATHTFSLINAGHEVPQLYRAEPHDLVDAIGDEATGLPLGVMPGFEYEAVTLTLEPGDSLTIFTDGVTDAMAPNGTMFGRDGVRKAILTADPREPGAYHPRLIGERLINAVRKHANGRAQNDDIATVCFGRLSGDEALPAYPPTGPNPIVTGKSH